LTYKGYLEYTIEAVLMDYKDETPVSLSKMTHNERPWIEARGGIPEGERSSNIIDKIVMQDYYGRKVL